MSDRGRPTTPTQLRVLRGNPGKRPLPTAEPKPTLRKRTPSPPEFLGERARAIWRELARELHEMRVLTSADYRALALLCEALVTYEEARAEVRKGLVVTTDKGNLIQSPYLSIMNRAAADAAKLLSEFGMTPSGRAKVRTVAESDEDAFDQLLHGENKTNGRESPS